MTRTGAARLAARAGLRVGAGLVTVASPSDALAVNAASLTAIMLRQADDAAQWRELLGDRRFSAVVIGPGFGVGEATREIVATLLAAAEKGEGATARPGAGRRRLDVVCVRLGGAGQAGPSPAAPRRF